MCYSYVTPWLMYTQFSFLGKIGDVPPIGSGMLCISFLFPACVNLQWLALQWVGRGSSQYMVWHLLGLEKMMTLL